MKLILLSALQGILAVGGMGLLNQSLGGRTLEYFDVMQGVFTVKGILGAIMLLLSSFVMFFILTFARLSEYVPISTAAVYFITIIYAVVFQGERVSVSIILGMVMIIGGIAIIGSNK